VKCGKGLLVTDLGLERHKQPLKDDLTLVYDPRIIFLTNEFMDSIAVKHKTYFSKKRKTFKEIQNYHQS